MGESFVFISDTNKLLFCPLVLVVTQWLLGFEGGWCERMSPPRKDWLGGDMV